MQESTKCGSNSAVECQLPKLDVAGSIPVSRSILSITYRNSLDGLLSSLPLHDAKTD